MYTLLDRANGQIITTIQDQDLKVLQDHLEAESSEDFDFYINEATLAYLLENGLSETVSKALEEKLQGRGLDVGWEREVQGMESLHFGSVVDDEGQPLGGIRVDLLDNSELKAGRLQEVRKILDWTYSREDGSFRLETTLDAPGTELRFSGRGDLVLHISDLEAVGEQGQFTIQTITGTAKTPDGAALVGVSVQLVTWSLADGGEDEDSLGGSLSWGDTDSAGRFAIPVHLPDDQGEVEVRLEVIAPSGESLALVDVNFDPSEGYEIGDLTASAPLDEWGDEEDVYVEEATHRTFEHPLQ